MLLRAERERVDVDAGVRGTSVELVRLDEVEVGALTLREAVLAVELKLGGDNRVLAPAVHVKSGLRSDERKSIAAGGLLEVDNFVDVTTTTSAGFHSAEIANSEGASSRRDRINISERLVRIEERIAHVGVVERLSTITTIILFAVINDVIILDNPYKLLARVVEVELDLVGVGGNRLIASELKLLNEVLVRVLGHAAALVGVEEHVVDVKRRGNNRVDVGVGVLRRSSTSDGKEALVDRAKVKVDLHLVVLEGNERKGKARVAAVPELERHVKSGLRQRLARVAYLIRYRIASGADVSVSLVGEVGKLGGLANHLVVTTLLLLGEGELVPDVHPVAVLAVNALAANLNLNLRDKLLTREVEPPHLGIDITSLRINLRESDLKVGAVGEVAVAADGAGYAAAEISLAVESLLDRLHREVGVATVSHLPESDLRVTGKVNILSAVGYELH